MFRILKWRGVILKKYIEVKDDAPEYGKRIARILNEKDCAVTQAILAKEAGISTGAMSNLIHGVNTPSIDVIQRIAKFLNVSVDYLLGNTDIKTPNIKLQAIEKYTGLSEQAIQIFKDISSWSSKSHNPNFSKGVNDFICSGHFVQLIMQYIAYKRAVEIVEYRLQTFSGWLVEHEVKPPQDLLAYAHRLAIEQQTPEAIEVVNCQENVRYAQFKLQRILHLITDDVKNGGEDRGINP